MTRLPQRSDPRCWGFMKDVSGTFDFGENFIRFGSPGEWARVRVVRCDERFKGGEQRGRPVPLVVSACRCMARRDVCRVLVTKNTTPFTARG